MRSAFGKNGSENVHWTQASIAGEVGFAMPVSHGRQHSPDNPHPTCHGGDHSKSSNFFSECCMAQRLRCPGGRPSVSSKKKGENCPFIIVGNRNQQ